MNQINPAAIALIRMLYDQALQTVKPDLAVRNAITLDSDQLLINGEPLPVSGRVHLVAIGKAAVPMTSGAFDVLGDRVETAFALTKHGHGFGVDDPRLRVFEASHPVPDETTILGTEALLDHLSSLSRDDVVLFLISGGGSAILEAPIDGITLDDMAKVTRLLLRAGAPIQDLNAVRTPLSRVKGGGLRRATPVDITATLLLSDVLGNDPRVIASGPTVPSSANPMRALDLIDRYGLRSDVPSAVINRLETDTPLLRSSRTFEGDLVRVIADNDIAIEAIGKFAHQLELPVRDIWHGVEGEARVRGVGWVDEIDRHRLEPAILVGGGETTVTVRGEGTGGRNSEFAVAAAERLRELRLTGWTVASLASDGEDALTGAAGGIVNAASAEAARETGDAPERTLETNDTFSWIERWGEPVSPGPTGTNVNDLYLAVPESVAEAFAERG